MILALGQATALEGETTVSSIGAVALTVDVVATNTTLPDFSGFPSAKLTLPFTGATSPC